MLLTLRILPHVGQAANHWASVERLQGRKEQNKSAEIGVTKIIFSLFDRPKTYTLLIRNYEDKQKVYIMVEILKTINSALAFLLELIMLAAFSHWGFHGEKSVLIKWLLGIGTPLAVAFIWGLYLAPNAKHRLNITPGIILSFVLFLGAAIALYQTGHFALAITFAIIIIINRVLLLFWRQW